MPHEQTMDTYNNTTQTTQLLMNRRWRAIRTRRQSAQHLQNRRFWSRRYKAIRTSDTHKLCTTNSRSYSGRRDKFTTVLFHERADSPTRRTTSASELFIVMTEFPWIYSHLWNEHPGRTCIRLIPHTYRPHLHRILSRMF